MEVEPLGLPSPPRVLTPLGTLTLEGVLTLAGVLTVVGLVTLLEATPLPKVIVNTKPKIIIFNTVASSSLSIFSIKPSLLLLYIEESTDISLTTDRGSLCSSTERLSPQLPSLDYIYILPFDIVTHYFGELL
jgi:hypothetical protein